MDENLRDYMSKEEQEQMDALLARAVQRKERRKASATGSKRFQFFKCQCGCVEGMGEEDDAEEEETEEDFYGGIDRLLREICSFCLKNGLCKHICPREAKKKVESACEEDEELPF